MLEVSALVGVILRGLGQVSCLLLDFVDLSRELQFVRFPHV